MYLCVVQYVQYRPFISAQYLPSPGTGLEVRMDFDIPVQEKDFLEKRRVVVGQALQKVLNLASPPEPKKVHGDGLTLATSCSSSYVFPVYMRFCLCFCCSMVTFYSNQQY